MAYATSVQNENAVRNGGFKIEVGDSFDSMVNMGVAVKMGLKNNHKILYSEADNGPDYNRRVVKQSTTFKMTLTELDWMKIAILNGGIIQSEEVSDGQMVYRTQNSALTATKTVTLQYPNIRGYEATAIGVTYTNATGETVETTRYVDYSVSTDGAGYTQIARTANSAIPSGTVCRIAYKTTTAKYIKSTYGQFVHIKNRCMRLTNVNDKGQNLVYLMTNASINDGEDIDISGNDSKDPWQMQVEMLCLPDPKKDNIVYEVLDYQGVVA